MAASLAHLPSHGFYTLAKQVEPGECVCLGIYHNDCLILKIEVLSNGASQ
jgi:hypothetical protein